MKKLLFTLCMLAACTTMHAAKASSNIVKVLQPDGTYLNVRTLGDEHCHWSTTTDGILLYQQGRHYFVANVAEDGSISNSGIIAHEAAQRQESEIAAAKAQNRETFYAEAKKSMETGRKLLAETLADGSPAYFPRTGTPKILVVLVNFADTTFCMPDPVASFNDYFNYMGEGRLPARGNKEERNRMSVANYFKKCSNGQFVPQFIVKGPVNLSQPQAYYGADSGNNTDVNINKLFKEAIDSIAPQVDFTEYDNDNNGYVDAVMFVHAGYEQSISGNSSDCIWAKASGASLGVYNGKTIYRYCIIGERRATPETFANQMNGIGICCHEFSHCLGLPDIYPTVTKAQINNQAMEDWDLMDGGEYLVSGFFPTPYTPWEKELMGWKSMEEISEPQLVTLAPDSAVKVMADDGKQYVILHNMQFEDSVAYDRYNHGLLIHRIDLRKYKTISMATHPNNTAGVPGVSIVPADSLLITIYKVSNNDPAEEGYYTSNEYMASYKGDVYPGTGNVTRVDSITLNDSVIVSKPLFNIREEAGDAELPNIVFAFIDETVDAIKEIDSKKIASDDIYSINGYRLNSDATLQKGIYIKGGKKYIVK